MTPRNYYIYPRFALIEQVSNFQGGVFPRKKTTGGQHPDSNKVLRANSSPLSPKNNRDLPNNMEVD